MKDRNLIHIIPTKEAWTWTLTQPQHGTRHGNMASLKKLGNDNMEH